MPPPDIHCALKGLCRSYIYVFSHKFRLMHAPFKITTSRNERGFQEKKKNKERITGIKLSYQRKVTHPAAETISRLVLLFRFHSRCLAQPITCSLLHAVLLLRLNTDSYRSVRHWKPKMKNIRLQRTRTFFSVGVNVVGVCVARRLFITRLFVVTGVSGIGSG